MQSESGRDVKVIDKRASPAADTRDKSHDGRPAGVFEDSKETRVTRAEIMEGKRQVQGCAMSYFAFYCCV